MKQATLGINQPTRYRFVDEFYNQYRISLWIPHKRKNIAFYCEPTLSLNEIERRIRQRFAEEGVPPSDIDYIMRGWPHRVKQRKPTLARSSNQSGYLGVVARANLKSISYSANYFCQGRIMRSQSFIVPLIPTADEEVYLLSYPTLVKAFVQACKASDALRHKSPKPTQEYVSVFQMADYAWLINRERERRQGKGRPLTITPVDVPESETVSG